MALVEPDRRGSLFSMCRSLDLMGFKSDLIRKATKATKVPYDSSNSPSVTSSSEIDFEPSFVSGFVSDNSEEATTGSSKVKRDAPGWRRSGISLLRGSKTRLAKLLPETGTDCSNSDSEGVSLNSSNSSSMFSSSRTDFEADLKISERDAIGGSQEITGSLAGSFLSGSKKSSANLRADGRMESPCSEVITEECRRQELASKVEEDPIPAHEEDLKKNLQLTVVHDDQFPTGRDELHRQDEQDGHKPGSIKARKGFISMPNRVKQLRKSKPDEHRRKVIVNGVPIKDVDVKKAEEHAGPIHPGNYWYDIQAGFWGLEPGPCLGIIPPCIIELNAPMSRFCSGGSTDILVNGRELHEKDLERLSFRGLPSTPGMAYCISIDGRVIDESSRRYVTCLGMLAPSLGKNGRGSGMYMPAIYD